jgi:hypothetical protein
VTPRHTAGAVLALTVAGVAVSLVLPSSGQEDDMWATVASVVFALGFGVVGALVASRRPENPIGWIMSVAGLAYATGAVSVTYVESTLAADGELLTEVAGWVSSWVWMVGIGPAATFMLLLFPDGRLPSRRWRPVAWLAGAGLGLMLFGIASGLDAVGVLGSFGLFLAALASVASLIVRFRRSRGAERAQLKWLTYAAAVVSLILLLVIVVDTVGQAGEELSNALVTGSIAALPVSIGIAILRHGVFDIDVVINRTLVYGALTATLAAAYLGSVLLLQLALSPLTQDSDLAIAGSTLAVAALFRPARARIQELVDRRFYRGRYDAGRTLERFGARVRDQVELDALGAELRAAVAETMQPAHVSLWLRGPAR